MTTEMQNELTENNQTKRVTAVFGGTFDPIHLGHVKLAEEVIRLDLADEVMFIPAAKPPHKLEKPISSPHHRIQMLQLVVDQHPKFSMSDYEVVNRRKTSFTANTLRALQLVFPERRFSLMIGMDNFLELDSWYKYQEIISQYELIIFTRPQTKRISLHKIAEKFGQRFTSKLDNSIIDTVDVDISATEIRKRVLKGQNLSGLVLPAVANYITENGLYK